MPRTPPARRSPPHILRDERRPHRPFRSPAHEATVALLRAVDGVRRRLAAVLGAHGVTLQQFTVLRILRGAGRDGLPTLEIGERMIEHAPGITRLLDRLAAKRLVERRRGDDDRRRVDCRITAAGQALLAALDGPVDDADRAALRGLSVAEQRELVRLLALVRAGG
jgi:DNA-binding MarR family transcriptional regulator